MKWIEEWRTKATEQQVKWVTALGSLALGGAAALIFHYVFYRLTLPVQPFIYVAF